MARKKQTLAKLRKQNGKKAVHKKSDFSIDRLQHPHQRQHGGHNASSMAAAGSPNRYLYGKSTAPSAKHTNKRKGKQKAPPPFKKKKKNKYEAKLPMVDGNSKPVPWWRKEAIQQLTKQQQQEKRKGQPKDSNTAKKPRQQPVVKLLDGALTANESCLLHLNAELQEFGKYVRLSAVEQDARHFLIQKIQQICQQLFGIDKSQCQVFGSFAAPDVCIFESDIDLAIWGVVEPEDEKNDDPLRISINRKRSISLADDSLPGEEGVNESNDKKEASPPEDHPNRRKQEKVRRWKEALDLSLKEAEASAAGKEQQSESKKAKDAKSAGQEKTEQTADNDVSDLFVLDRVGVAESIVTESSNATGKQSEVIDLTSDSSRVEIDGVPKPTDNSDDESYQDASDSEEDDADKLEGLVSRKANTEEFRRSRRLGESFHVEEKKDDSGTTKGEDAEDDDSDNDSLAPFRARAQSMTSLSSATTCSDNEKFDESGMEVSFMVDRTQQRKSKKPMGPTGRARTMVVNALYKITRHLRPYAATLHVRKKARVPIINISSHFGFECDIAMGGHNGTDTSSYASSQVARFKSFPIVVVVLKILLGQHGLDKPFTGGLGSFSLYVLVANHLEHHLADGGSDDPAEVLVTFLFRYGAVRHSSISYTASSRTELHQQMVIETSDGGSTDMGCCYQVESIVNLFSVCYHALCKKLTSNVNGKYSMLQYILDAEKLEIGRGRYKRQASSKLNQFSGGNGFSGSTSFTNIRAPQMQESATRKVTDTEAEKLIKSYNQDVASFMPPKRTNNKRQQELMDRIFAPIEEPKPAKKAKQGGKKKGKNKSNKRRRTI